MPCKESKKESTRKFKEQKPRVGTYAVRCTATGMVWVGASRNLDATKNGCWFMLRNGSHQDKFLQAAWDAQGENSFEYEVLALLDEDVHPLNVPALLKEKKISWLARLGASPLL
jgi:hypothetical protein